MDLETRKLNAIEYLIGLRDEKILRRIESLINDIQIQKQHERKLKPFTEKQLIDRAKQSNKDYETGRFKTQEQLEKESDNW